MKLEKEGGDQVSVHQYEFDSCIQWAMQWMRSRVMPVHRHTQAYVH